MEKGYSVDGGNNWGPRSDKVDPEMRAIAVGYSLQRELNEGVRTPQDIFSKAEDFCNSKKQYEGKGCKKPNHSACICMSCKVNVVKQKTRGKSTI